MQHRSKKRRTSESGMARVAKIPILPFAPISNLQISARNDFSHLKTKYEWYSEPGVQSFYVLCIFTDLVVQIFKVPERGRMVGVTIHSNHSERHSESLNEIILITRLRLVIQVLWRWLHTTSILPCSVYKGSLSPTDRLDLIPIKYR